MIEHTPKTGKGKLKFRVMLALLTCIMVLGVHYAYTLVVFNISTTKITRNFAAEWDTKIPKGERAWPVLREAQGDFKQVAKTFVNSNDWPLVREKSEEWATALEVRERLQSHITACKAASKYPSMGYYLSGTDGDPTPLITSAYWVLVPHSQINATRNAVRMLMFDAWMSLQLGESARVVEDMDAGFRLGNLLLEQPNAMEQLTRYACHAGLFTVIQRALIEYPDKLSDADLRSIQEIIRETTPDRYHSDLEPEKTSFQDYAQRVFTDDGHGDGEICADGARKAQGMLAEWGVTQPVPALNGWMFPRPFVHQHFGTRKEFIDTCEHYIDLAKEEYDGPFWTWTAKSSSEQQLLQQTSRLGPSYAQRLIGVIIPSYRSMMSAGENLTQVRDVTGLALALELWRRKHGTYPSELKQLVPDFIDTVPPDRYNGKPLLYRLIDNKPIIYSVGPDGDDDNGLSPRRRGGEAYNPQLRHQEDVDGDWVLYPHWADVPPAGVKGKSERKVSKP